VSARTAFSRLPHPTSSDWAALLRANDASDYSVRDILNDMLSKLDCSVATDSRFVGSTLQKASRFKDADLMERMWGWSLGLRQYLLQCNGPDPHGIAVSYIQYAVTMSRMGHIDRVLQVWNEWQQSPLGSSGSALFSDMLHSAVISAVATHGDSETAEELFNSRPSVYAKPTPGFNHCRTLRLLITAHAHAGFPKRAVSRLQQAEATGSVDVFVYNATIDACARAGDFEQAQAIINRMRSRGVQPDVITWMTLLGPCRSHRNLPVATYAFDQLLRITTADKDVQAAAYVVLAGVCHAVGRSNLAEELHARRLSLGLHKERGAVEVNVEGRLHRFHVGEVPEGLASDKEAIESKLDEWARVLSEREVSTESITCRHSEKLALAFAVLKGQKDISLRKNLRICPACHDASCAITTIEGIVIRHQDRSRVHIMQEGRCSCEGRY
jgi:pentatricopeptide repeat protein